MSWDLTSLSPGLHILRVDYGYPDPPAPGWSVVDLAKVLLSDLPGGLVSPPSPAVPSSGNRWFLKNADRLLAWGRLRGRGPDLATLRGRKAEPLLLQCRFPRDAGALARLLGESGKPVPIHEAPRDGSIPPLYQTIRSNDMAIRLHLELEWVSALAHARGDAALEQVGLLLVSGPRRGSEIASALGVTAGAARSYLQWMEDVSLVRREGRRFALAHPLLAERFRPRQTFGPNPAPPPSRSSDEMDVD